MRWESSSRKDQLEAPVSDDLSCQGRLQPLEDGFGPPPQPGLPLPGEIVAEQSRGLPMGGDLEYVDGVTLAHALVARQEVG